jgi:hypothetical protein
MGPGMAPEDKEEWHTPEEGHFCGSIHQNKDGSFTGFGSIEGNVTINGETYSWCRDVKFKLKKVKNDNPS